MMKKSYIVRLLLVISLLLTIFMPRNALAAEKTLGDLRKAYEDLLKQKQENDNKTANTEAEIAKKQQAINQANEDIATAQDEQEEAQLKIQESNENIESLKSESEKVLLYMQQMQGQNAYVEYVSGASSMTELITRIEAVKQVSGYIQDTVKNLEQEIVNNEKLKIELEEKEKALEEQVVSYQNTISNYYKDLEEFDAFAETIDEKVQAAKEDYELNKRICQQNIGKTDDSVVISSCSKVPVNSGWLKPLNYGVITSLIGSRWGSYHNALDIGGNAEGTPVYAAAAGTVIATQYRTSCGGNRVYIYSYVNGKYYTHFYYHLLSYNVKVGDTVDQNTIIGYVGGGAQTSSKYGGYDTCTTGAHLHFGIAEGRQPYHTTNVLTQLPGYSNYVGYRWYTRF